MNNDNNQCPMCGSPEAVFLGALGQVEPRAYVRCRACGWNYRVESWVVGVSYNGAFDEEVRAK
jgi:RNA polymerase subunit RPABC4/transcription elongation factor Spt4